MRMVDQDERLLILGSLNANADDRTSDRKSIRPLQSINPDMSLSPVPYFNNWGELGLSSLAWQEERPEIWFLSTGTDIHRIDLENQKVTQVSIPKIKGIHEMTLVGDILWITNTFFDEIISYDTITGQVTSRSKLNPGEVRIEDISDKVVDEHNLERINKFHCNQIVESFEGELLALVHHVNGEQAFRRVAQKIVKSQGNGGIINLSNGQIRRLGLKAPHTVRKVDHCYYVFNSGHSTLSVFNHDWTLEHEVKLSGWGRGGVFSTKTEKYYCGISPKRKRYLNFNQATLNSCLVEAMNGDFSIIDSMEIPNIEQVNNLYLISSDVFELLMNFKG